MKSLQRPLSLLVTLAMVLSLFCGAAPVAAAAEAETESPAPSAAASEMYWRIYEPQLLKMLYVAGQISGGDGVSIDSVVMQFVQNVNGVDSWELKPNGSPVYYCPMRFLNLVEWKLNTAPDNIKQLHVTYTVGGDKRETDLAASQLRYVKTADDTYEVRAAGDSVYAMAFYAESSDLRLHSVRFVERGKQLGADHLPANPDMGSGNVFVAWDLKKEGGAPFDPSQPVQEDTTVYARKLTSTFSGTEFHVINRDNRLLNRVAEQYSAGLPEGNAPITAEQIDAQSLNVIVRGDGAATDPGKLLYGWKDGMDYFLVSNTSLGGTHINPAKVEGLEVSFRLKGSEETRTVKFSRGYAADQFQVTVPASDHIAELLFNAAPVPLTKEAAALALAGSAVKVTCAAGDSGHGSETYGLLQESITGIGEVRYTARGYECRITLSPELYAAKFGQSHGGHGGAEPAERTITMRYTENRQWVPAEVLPVEFRVSCTPVPSGHTLTYDANGGYWGSDRSDKTRNETGLPTGWHEMSYLDTAAGAAPAPVHDPVNRDGTQIKTLFVGWSLDPAMANQVLDKDSKPGGMLIAKGLQMERDFTAYAVWAEDRNGNGLPDYQEMPIKVRFDAAAGTTVESREFTLLPFPDRPAAVFAPEVTPPRGQQFVKWTLEGDEKQTLGSRGSFTYDSIFQMTGGKKPEVTFRAVYQTVDAITIQPADITIYMGGSGYQSVVRDQSTGEVVMGVSNGFPEPAFRITLPKSLQDQRVAVTDLVLQYQDGGSTLTWRPEPYGAGASDLYRLVPGQGTARRPLQMEFKKDGRIITEDRFDVRQNLNQTLEMAVHGRGIQADKVHFTYGGHSYQVAGASGLLTVRGTTDRAQFSTVNGSSRPAPRMPAAMAAPGTTYTVNGSKMQVTDTSGISLLFDNVIETNRVASRTNSELLAAKADQFLGSADLNRRYEFKYLDLVDRNNGNVWVEPGRNVTIYWPLPQGTDKNTQFQVLHFAGIHRSAGTDQIAAAIQSSRVERVAGLRVTDTHVVIDVGSSGFSPFALVWRNGNVGSAAVTYFPNGGQGQARTETYLQNTPIQVPGGMFTRIGYTFTGWSTAANGKGTTYLAGQKVSFTGNLRLYAQWRENGTLPVTDKYALYYETNGGRKLDPESGKKAWVKEYKKLPVPERSGYLFEGWYYNKSLSRAVTGNVQVDGTVVLYAKWRQNGIDPKTDKYALYYETNGGKKLDPESGKKAWVKEYKKLPVPERSGYLFEGWYYNKNLTRAVTSSVKVDGAVTLYAKWRQNGSDPKTDKYVLTYETNGGKKLDPESGEKAWVKEYKKLPIPERSGYLFEGWYHNQTLTMSVTGNVSVDKAVTLYAKWREDKPAVVTDDTGVSQWLNTKDHMAYLQGLPNNRFGPGQNITRAEVAQMFYNLLLNRNVPTNVSFTDVPANAWYADAVKTLASMGVIKGVGGSRFAPFRNITRAEFTAIALRFGRMDSSATNRFSDVKTSDWFYREVSGAVRNGWIKGFTDGTFRPNLPITRAEVTVITNRMLGRSADRSYVDRNSGSLRRFADVGADNWAYYDILEAANSHSHIKKDGGEYWNP